MTQKKSKLFRDPVHNIISFELADPVEQNLFRLINTRAIQRLRRIRQLGFTHLVYHGAEHTRFSHSLGVFHVAKRMLETLDIDISDDNRFEVLAAALLHDIGHGPFSHATEEISEISHEDYSAQLIKDPETKVNQILTDCGEDFPKRIAQYFGPRADFPEDKQHLLDIVSSQLDADRLDYILRDGLATGVQIGVYDFERIQTMLTVYQDKREDGETSSRLAVGYRAREAVEDYLIARFHFFKQVYLHKAVRAAENMLAAVLQRAQELVKSGHELPNPHMETIDKMLRGERLSSPEFLELDDTSIWMLLKSWRSADDDILSRLAEGLLDRQLYKTVELQDQDPVEIARTIDYAKSLASKRDLEPDYSVISDHAHDTPYMPYDPEDPNIDMHIPIISPDGEPNPIEDKSDVVHLLSGDSYKIIRLCVPEVLRDQLEQNL
jgi:HD superfamily phosphohydrolase